MSRSLLGEEEQGTCNSDKQDCFIFLAIEAKQLDRYIKGKKKKGKLTNTSGNTDQNEIGMFQNSTRITRNVRTRHQGTGQ